MGNPAIDLCCRLRPHRAGDVGVDVQRGGRRYVAQHGGEGLHIHPVSQRDSGKCVPQIMETNLLTLGVFQNDV